MQILIISSAVILRILSNSFANVFQKKLAQNNVNPLSVNAFTYLILGVIGMLLLVFAKSVNFSSDLFVYSILVGIFGALGNGFLIKALEKGDLSVLGPINAYKAVVALVFGLLFLREIPTIAALAGMFLIIFGSYFVLDTLEERFSLKLFFNKQIQYRFLALVFTAIEAVFIKKLIILSSVSFAFVLWAVFGAIFSFFLLKFEKLSLRSELKHLSASTMLNFAAIVGCVGVMQYTTNFVFSKINVAYALALFQLSAVVSVFLGFKIFKEKDIMKKLCGTLLMVLGAVMVIVYN